MRVVNLSRRPFVNDRPVVRLAALLWVLGAVLLAVNIYSYTNYWIDSAEMRTELAEIEAEIEREQKSFGDLQGRFQRLDLDDMNGQAAFLNELIRVRTFPWSLLFENLEEVLPFDVKLESVRPELSKEDPLAALRRATERRGPSRRRSSSRQESPPPPPPVQTAAEEVALSLQGTAKSGDALLDFVDALFAHPSFRRPNLLRENLNDQTGLIAFEVSTTFLIKPPADESSAAEQTAGADDAALASGEDPEAAAIASETAGGEPAAGRGSVERAPPGSGASHAAPSGEPARTTAGILPQGAPSQPPAAGSPAAGSPAAPPTVLTGPAVRAPGFPSPPASAEGTPPGQRAAPPSASDESGETPEDRRPRFVEPDASDTVRIQDGSGGHRS